MTKREKDPGRLLFEELAARRLFKARKKMGLTQAELAEMLCFHSDKPIDPKTVYRWESRENPVPGWALINIEMLAMEYDQDTSDKSTKKMVLHQKASFIQRVIKKVRQMLKSDL